MTETVLLAGDEDEDDLPLEADDVTATELHQRLVGLLVFALKLAIGDQALVLSEVFVRHDGTQFSPDVAVVPGVRPGERSVYRVPDEPAPTVVLEVLSSSNLTSEGTAQLHRKRESVARLRVPLYLEVLPAIGTTTEWSGATGALELVATHRRFTHPSLGGVTLDTTLAGELVVLDPRGEPVLDAAVAVAQLQERAEALTRENEALARRREALEQALRRAGVDPDAV